MSGRSEAPRFDARATEFRPRYSLVAKVAAATSPQAEDDGQPPSNPDDAVLPLSASARALPVAAESNIADIPMPAGAPTSKWPAGPVFRSVGKGIGSVGLKALAKRLSAAKGEHQAAAATADAVGEDAAHLPRADDPTGPGATPYYLYPHDGGAGGRASVSVPSSLRADDDGPSLTAAGASSEDRRWNALHAAVCGHDPSVAISQLEHWYRTRPGHEWLGALDGKDSRGERPLHCAVRQGSGSHSGIVDFLLMSGADPTAKRTDGATPLHIAAARSDVGMVGALLGARADVNARMRGGYSALHVAIAPLLGLCGAVLHTAGSPSAQADAGDNRISQAQTAVRCIEALLEAGAGPNAPADDRMTPLLLCCIAGELVSHMQSRTGDRLLSLVRSMVARGAAAVTRLAHPPLTDVPPGCQPLMMRPSSYATIEVMGEGHRGQGRSTRRGGGPFGSGPGNVNGGRSSDWSIVGYPLSSIHVLASHGMPRALSVLLDASREGSLPVPGHGDHDFDQDPDHDEDNHTGPVHGSAAGCQHKTAWRYCTDEDGRGSWEYLGSTPVRMHATRYAPTPTDAAAGITAVRADGAPRYCAVTHALCTTPGVEGSGGVWGGRESVLHCAAGALGCLAGGSSVPDTLQHSDSLQGPCSSDGNCPFEAQCANMLEVVRVACEHAAQRGCGPQVVSSTNAAGESVVQLLCGPVRNEMFSSSSYQCDISWAQVQQSCTTLMSVAWQLSNGRADSGHQADAASVGNVVHEPVRSTMEGDSTDSIKPLPHSQLHHITLADQAFAQALRMLAAAGLDINKPVKKLPGSTGLAGAIPILGDGGVVVVPSAADIVAVHTPLGMALAHGRLSCVRALLDSGALLTPAILQQAARMQLHGQDTPAAARHDTAGSGPWRVPGPSPPHWPSVSVPQDSTTVGLLPSTLNRMLIMNVLEACDKDGTVSLYGGDTEPAGRYLNRPGLGRGTGLGSRPTPAARRLPLDDATCQIVGKLLELHEEAAPLSIHAFTAAAGLPGLVAASESHVVHEPGLGRTPGLATACLLPKVDPSLGWMGTALASLVEVEVVQVEDTVSSAGFRPPAALAAFQCARQQAAPGAGDRPFTAANSSGSTSLLDACALYGVAGGIVTDTDSPVAINRDLLACRSDFLRVLLCGELAAHAVGKPSGQSPPVDGTGRLPSAEALSSFSITVPSLSALPFVLCYLGTGCILPHDPRMFGAWLGSFAAGLWAGVGRSVTACADDGLSAPDGDIDTTAGQAVSVCSITLPLPPLALVMADVALLALQWDLPQAARQAAGVLRWVYEQCPAAGPAMTLVSDALKAADVSWPPEAGHEEDLKRAAGHSQADVTTTANRHQQNGVSWVLQPLATGQAPSPLGIQTELLQQLRQAALSSTSMFRAGAGAGAGGGQRQDRPSGHDALAAAVTAGPRHWLASHNANVGGTGLPLDWPPRDVDLDTGRPSAERLPPLDRALARMATLKDAALGYEQEAEAYLTDLLLPLLSEGQAGHGSSHFSGTTEARPGRPHAVDDPLGCLARQMALLAALADVLDIAPADPRRGFQELAAQIGHGVRASTILTGNAVGAADTVDGGQERRPVDIALSMLHRLDAGRVWHFDITAIARLLSLRHQLLDKVVEGRSTIGTLADSLVDGHGTQGYDAPGAVTLSRWLPCQRYSCPYCTPLQAVVDKLDLVLAVLAAHALRMRPALHLRLMQSRWRDGPERSPQPQTYMCPIDDVWADLRRSWMAGAVVDGATLTMRLHTGPTPDGRRFSLRCSTVVHKVVGVARLGPEVGACGEIALTASPLDVPTGQSAAVDGQGGLHVPPSVMALLCGADGAVADTERQQEVSLQRLRLAWHEACCMLSRYLYGDYWPAAYARPSLTSLAASNPTAVSSHRPPVEVPAAEDEQDSNAADAGTGGTSSVQLQCLLALGCHPGVLPRVLLLHMSCSGLLRRTAVGRLVREHTCLWLARWAGQMCSWASRFTSAEDITASMRPLAQLQAVVSRGTAGRLASAVLERSLQLTCLKLMGLRSTRVHAATVVTVTDALAVGSAEAQLIRQGVDLGAVTADVDAIQWAMAD